MPWVGCVSTAGDMMRFAGCCAVRALEDTRLVSAPDQVRTHHLDRRQANRSIPNGIRTPGNIARRRTAQGSPYAARRWARRCGTLASPGTFGAHGNGTTIIWVVGRDISFVGLMTGLTRRPSATCGAGSVSRTSCAAAQLARWQTILLRLRDCRCRRRLH
jgi:CubicO group peptidase (beta-lactamase class C family)